MLPLDLNIRLKPWLIGLLLLWTPVTLFAQGKPPATTIVIVHGAWGGAWQFVKIDPLLREHGYDVRRVTLTGLGDRNHLATLETGLETHITDVINIIRFEKLDNIILIGHSYGGMVISGVANRMPDRIAQLVYLDALLPVDGESVQSMNVGRGKALTDRAKDGFIAPWWVRPDKPFPKDVPHPLKTLTDPIELKNHAATTIPGSYILTVDPGKEEQQDDFYPSAQRARQRGWKVVTMEGDHNPHWRQPATTVEVLMRVISPTKE